MTEKRPTLRDRIRAVRGQAYLVTGRFDQAAADFNRAIELDPDQDWVVGERGETYQAMGRYDEALADFDRALEFDPGDDDQ